MSATLRSANSVLAIVVTLGSLAVLGQEQVTGGADWIPVTIENCGVSTTYPEPPRRVVTTNQAATELMLELGLQDRLVGTAYLDDAILPAFAAAYEKIPVLATQYPSRDEVLAVQADFVFAAYASAFTDDGVGPREDLGIRSYLSPSSCPGRRGVESVSMATLYRDVRDIGRIFGVSPRAEQVIASYQADIRATQARIGTVTNAPMVFWYDAGSPPSVGACCGMPNEIMRLVRAENVFKDKPGSWAPVSWKEVVERNPDAIVLVDAPWSSAVHKATLLSGDPAYATIEAVKHHRFVTIDFSGTSSAIRTAATVRRLAEALYPEKFSGVRIARSVPSPGIP